MSGERDVIMFDGIRPPNVECSPVPAGQERRPFRCPVCLGRQTVPAHLYAYVPTVGTNTNEVPCRTCHGTGVIWG